LVQLWRLGNSRWRSHMWWGLSCCTIPEQEAEGIRRCVLTCTQTGDRERKGKGATIIISSEMHFCSDQPRHDKDTNPFIRPGQSWPNHLLKLLPPSIIALVGVRFPTHERWKTLSNHGTLFSEI
jgi:hypothetical protein